MNDQRTLLVTGASGQLGRRVVELLLERGERSIVATTRTPDKLADLAARGVDVRPADFDDPKSLAAAFRGVTRALVISTDALDRPGRRLEQHVAAIQAAKDAGVRHVVYTSLVHAEPDAVVTIAPDHRLTEDAIRASGLSFTVLRNNLYADFLLGSLPHAVKSGKIVNASGTGAVSYVTREDCARAAAAALASSFEGKKVLDVTGPEAVTQADLARILGEVTGRSIEYVAIDSATSTKNLIDAGLPPPIAELLVSFESAIAKGHLSPVSAAVEELSGGAPTSLSKYLASQASALAT